MDEVEQFAAFDRFFNEVRYRLGFHLTASESALREAFAAGWQAGKKSAEKVAD